MKGLARQHNTYMVRIRVPADVKAAIGKSELIASLKTDSFSEAKKAAPPIIAGFKAQIERARTGASVPDVRLKVQMALAAWSLSIIGAPPGREVQTPWEAIEGAAALERAVADPDGWRQVPDFDARALEALAFGGARLAPNQLAPFRPEVALAFLFAEKHRERGRAVNASQIALRAAQTAPLDLVLPTEPQTGAQAVRPSMTLTSLFERWIAAEPPPDPKKDLGKLHHQIRRLVEFVGDIPANHITKVQIEQFFKLVALIPKRRTTALHAMPIREVAEWVTHENEREEEKADAEGRETELVETLTAKTAMLWFHGFQRMYRYAIRLELPQITRNPFEGMAACVKGDASIKRRGYTADEIATIFAKPLFGEETGAKRWLPILALHHGARLSELAAMPGVDFKRIDNHWVFDLSDRKLKTESSSRIIPLHPEMVRLGWLNYVASIKGKWLFGDLDHESTYGPGHEFSKWWGMWMDEQGLTDPALTFHSFRHAWKRRARASDVKEEMHNVISGHKGYGVGQDYGRGADIGPLVKAMALITFPEFPL